jgi:hypothetical protein
MIEAIARRSEMLPESSATICVGLDRTSVPMEEDLPEGTPVPERKKPRVRKAPSPVEVNFRMAYVGTVALVDADGDALRVFKYSATPEDGPAQVLHSMMQDIRRSLRQRPTLRVLVVQDAGKEMWNLLTDALAAEPTVRRWDELIDHPHAMSHLWAAADAIDQDTGKLMAEWKTALREHDDAIEAIHERIVHEIGLCAPLAHHPRGGGHIPHQQQAPAPLRRPPQRWLSDRFGRYRRRVQVLRLLPMQALRSALAKRGAPSCTRLPYTARQRSLAHRDDYATPPPLHRRCATRSMIRTASRPLL